MEIRSFFSELGPRLDSIELAGAPEYVASTFVGGLTHLPGHMVGDDGYAHFGGHRASGTRWTE
jgi:hypothetical protein